jgi:hypothetical protein
MNKVTQLYLSALGSFSVAFCGSTLTSILAGEINQILNIQVKVILRRPVGQHPSESGDQFFFHFLGNHFDV